MATKLTPESKERKSAFDQEYMRKNVTRKLLPFNRTVETDVKILDWLEQKPNMTQYIKTLILADMEKAGK